MNLFDGGYPMPDDRIDPDLLAERDALRAALTLIVAQFEGIDDDKWPTEGMKVAIQQARVALDAAEEAA